VCRSAWGFGAVYSGGFRQHHAGLGFEYCAFDWEEGIGGGPHAWLVKVQIQQLWEAVQIRSCHGGACVVWVVLIEAGLDGVAKHMHLHAMIDGVRAARTWTKNNFLRLHTASARQVQLNLLLTNDAKL
jgi:hypothetical protein